MSILETLNVEYSYAEKKDVLRGISAAFDVGKMYAILGPSGCGKTTVLSLLGRLNSPTKGMILFEGHDIEKEGLSVHRKRHVAFVFQSYNLIDYLTPNENVALTSRLPPLPTLNRVGLSEEEAKRSVFKLSGGQQQCVAIARTLASEVPVILPDEPTDNLDEDTAAEITQILYDCAHGMNKCVIVVTHSGEIVNRADVALKLGNGLLQNK